MSKYHKNCTKEDPEEQINTCSGCPPLTSKVAECAKEGTCSHQEEPRSSLLDVLSPEKDCACETMARAVRSHLHMNIGMSKRRAAIKVEDKPSSEEIAPEK